mmetsp:Transcript_139012/g.337671  ORF Transcript_139012/g.337671 Transcript_139012/m.337671 type:complete len:320 (-) Transcript_139012:252-1211(-)
MSARDPTMNGYQQMDRGQLDHAHRVDGHVLRRLGLGSMSLVLVALIAVLKWPGSSLAPGSGASFLTASHGLKTSSESHLCNCPPSEAIWKCSENEYHALMNGTTCMFYATSSYGKCQACPRDETSLECRACTLGLRQQDMCDQCNQQGLNDVGCRECREPSAASLPGGDADQHDCRPSAGYRWCEATSSCVRPWELGLHTPEAFKAKCLPAAASMLRAGGDADSHGCRPSAGYRWCHAKEACIRLWEEDMKTEQDFVVRCEREKVNAVVVGGDRDEHGCIPSAGYSWCEATSECIRPWERGIHSESEFRARCSGEKVYP